jgi:anti-sigma B factor antagonist
VTELDVNVNRSADHAVVTVRGRVFYDTVPALAQALEPMLATEHPRIVLDLSEVDICDSSGLSLIVASHITAVRAGGWLRLAGLRPMVRRAVAITNLASVLSIHDTVDDAVTGPHHPGT